METMTVATARWLVSDDGAAAVAAAVRSLDAGEDELTTTAAMRRQVAVAEHGAAAVTAAVARRRARDRWPDAERLLFTRHGLEEASDPDVAAWRARRLVHGPGVGPGREAADDPYPPPEVWDLGAGLGGDTVAIARAGARVTAVEHDPARCVLLAHNLAVSGVDARVVRDDAGSVVVPAHARVHVDPARRREGRRVRDLDEHRPAVGSMLRVHGHAAGLAITLAPGVDADDAVLGEDVEVEYVQLGGDLVEAIAWRGDLRAPRVTASATLLPAGLRRARTGPRGPRLAVGDPGSHLVEVAVAAVRARLHDDIGAGIGARRLSVRRALLTTDRPPPASPWYRARRIEAVLPPRPPRVRRWLADADPAPVELVLHGFDADVTAWWRALGRPPRGPSGWRIELVRRDDDAIAVITRADDGSGAPEADPS